MGETPLQAQYAESQPQPPSLSHPHIYTTAKSAANFSPPSVKSLPTAPPSAYGQNGDVSNTEEEPYTIKCICGFLDDDGSTVFCEQCNTWQHIVCYYPDGRVPEVHKCTDCSPRLAFLDPEEARERQKRLREGLRQPSDERRAKRSGQKGNRKPKPKDANHALAANGWSAGEQPQHLESNSPNHSDQPPPSKRTKTAHKGSGPSSSNSRPTNHRHRSSSNIDSSPIKLPPEGHMSQFLSPDFIRIHQTNPDFTPAQTNLHLDISVTNLLSDWLDDPDALAAATNGLTLGEVFKQYPQPIEELETTIQKRTYTEPNVQVHGGHPTWHYLTIDQDLGPGDFVGELRGTIGHRDEYRSDPSNNWERLRHPEHFVFFHPYLPISIDCRSEGTLLRYARRSCRPNLKLETIITGAREYRFCFTAVTPIPRGTEITVGWDTLADPQLQKAFRLGSTAMSDSQKAFVQDWVVTILAHFGGCACNSTDDSPCLMEHFDPRLDGIATKGGSSRSSKLPSSAASKRRRSMKKSPPASNSRLADQWADSEGANVMDVDDDADETRSTSRSSRSRASREGSPSAMDSPRDGTPQGNEILSERDKKKLLQQERLFDKLAQEEQLGHRKKKRPGNSVNMPLSNATSRSNGRGSSTNPNTPVPGSRSRLVDHMPAYFGSLSVQSPDGLSSRGRSPVDYPSRVGQIKGSPTATNAGAPTRLAPPVYVDSCTQTVFDESNNACPPSPDGSEARPPRTYLPLSQRILRRSHLRAVQAAKKLAAKSPEDDVPAIVKAGTSPASVPAQQSVLTSTAAANPGVESRTEEPDNVMMVDEKVATPCPQTIPNLLPRQDVEMTDADGISAHDNNETTREMDPKIDKGNIIREQPAAIVGASQAPEKPPAPPWPERENASNTKRDGAPTASTRQPNLHVDLPPPQFSNAAPLGALAVMASPGTPVRASAPPLPSNGNTVSAASAPTPAPAPATAPILTPGINSTSSSSNGGFLHANAAVQPSPAKKKMSLSDYMQKRKAETPANEKPVPVLESVVDGSPTSTSGETGAPPLSQSGRKSPAPAALSSPTTAHTPLAIKSERSEESAATDPLPSSM